MSRLLAPTRLKRYVAVRLTALPTDRLARLHPDYAAGPLATTRSVANTVLIDAVNAAAATLSIAPGMTLAGARALCPGLKTAPADDRADARFLEEVAGWCGGFTPRVGHLPGEAAGVMLDITGCAHLFGGEEGLLDRLEGGLTRFGLSAALALAGSPGTALALTARFGGGGRFRLDPDMRASDALGDLPVAALLYVEPGLDPSAVAGLDRVGLRRLSDLYAVPRASLAKRFGMALVTALDKSLGHAAAPIAPRAHKRPWRVRIGFPDPIGLRGDIDAALDRLSARMGARLADRELGARRFELAVERTDGTVQRLAVGSVRPARDPAYIAALFERKMEEIEPGYGIDRMVLAARRVEAFDAAQDGFSTDAGADKDDGRAHTNAAECAVIDRIANRLGDGNLFRLVPRDTHLPDRAQDKASPSETGGGGIRWNEISPRPVRLYARPRMASPAGGRGEKGVPTAFRLAGRTLAVHRVEGPERIGPEWWRRDAGWAGGLRDYFRLTMSDGRRLWLYREAPKVDMGAGMGAGDVHPRWFLHGVFP